MIALTFFQGTSLKPMPAGKSKHERVRYLDIYEGQFDPDQFVVWVQQAAQLPCERM